MFPHTLDGSLGSTVRVRELYTSMIEREGIEIEIFSPYETPKMAWNRIPVRNKTNLNDSFLRLVYKLSRKLYYNKTFISLYSNPRFRTFLDDRLANAMRKTIESGRKPDMILAELDVSIKPSIKVARELGIPVIVDMHNCTPEELVASGLINEHDVEYKSLHSMLEESLKLVDGIAVVSSEMKDFLHHKYDIPLSTMFLVPPGAKPRALARDGMNSSLVFAGMVTYREHVDLFVKSMPLILDRVPKARFYVTRRGEMLPEIMRLATDLGVSIDYFWHSGEDDFYRFLATCDIGVLPSSRDNARLIGTPVKLLDYISVGLPVVANHIGGWSDMIGKYKIGITTGDSPKEFADAALSILSNPDLAEKFRKNALSLVAGPMSWHNSAASLIDLIKKVS